MSTHYDRNGDDVRTWAGFKYSTISRTTRTLVVVVDNRDERWETGNTDKWLTICDAHSTVCSHTTHRIARDHAADPTQWCEPCSGADMVDTRSVVGRATEPAVVNPVDALLATADRLVDLCSRLDTRSADEIADEHDRRLADLPCTIFGSHCESCGSTDYEDLTTGDQGYTACCNELIAYDSRSCRNHHGRI